MAERSPQGQRAWILLGFAVGVLAAAGIALISVSGVAQSAEGATPSALQVLGGAVATISLAGLTGWGVAHLLRLGTRPSVLAVGGAVAAFLVERLIMLQPPALVLSVAAIAVAQRTWVRGVAGVGVALSLGNIIAWPAIALLLSGGVVPQNALLLGLGGGVAIGAVAAIVLTRRGARGEALPGVGGEPDGVQRGDGTPRVSAGDGDDPPRTGDA